MEGWIAAVVAVVAAVLGALFLRGRQAGNGGAPGTSAGTPAGTTPAGTTPAPATGSTDQGASNPPAPEPPPGGAPVPTSAPAGGGGAATPDQGLPGDALSPIAPFDPDAISGGLLVKAVEAGQFEAPTWVEIEWDGLLVQVGAHALRARVGDRLLRLPVSWTDTVAICKKLGWCPPTSALSDAVWKAATVKVAPVPIGDFSTPAKAKESSKKMVRLGYCQVHNQNIDSKIPPERAPELCATEGKDWILSKRNLTAPRAATTYGWHQANGKPIQGLGPDAKPPAHDDGHFDETQVLRPIRRQARRAGDGTPTDLLDELEKRGLPAAVTKAMRD